MKKSLKHLTLTRMIRTHGLTSAAALCGVSVTTLWRWHTRRTSPAGNNARRLVELGIKII